MSAASERAGMRFLEGGSFWMGSERFYPEEAPRHQTTVDPFWIDTHPVTNRDFAAFVAATGYVTTAEIPPDPTQYPGMPTAMARAGSLVFRRTLGPVDVRDPSRWWEFCVGAHWRHPLGPTSDLAGLEDHPVVHVTAADAERYAAWVGKSLPTEAEWEFAARGGLDGREYAWGDELAPGRAVLANYWQGEFPWENTLQDGFERTSPVNTFPPNGYGIFDMIGNVWEWTADWYALPPPAGAPRCCVPDDARERDSGDPALPGVRIGRRVIKGGSHLCGTSYCQRYRPAARQPQSIDTSTSHLGFRCIVRKRALPQE